MGPCPPGARRLSRGQAPDVCAVDLPAVPSACAAHRGRRAAARLSRDRPARGWQPVVGSRLARGSCNMIANMTRVLACGLLSLAFGLPAYARDRHVLWTVAGKHNTVYLLG